jgi:hypothetical protein
MLLAAFFDKSKQRGTVIDIFSVRAIGQAAAALGRTSGNSALSGKPGSGSVIFTRQAGKVRWHCGADPAAPRIRDRARFLLKFPAC